ncbi:helix-turn-helix domain-containing protein [Halalkalibacter oceani]|uniref:helix-turn-helix domain-containing protein n=1 Tax=Halalkalibacter oceani TaxID=1653776 RepID=UPI003D815E5C
MIQALHSYKEMTVQQLLEKLEDVPQATMYRHLKVLRTLMLSRLSTRVRSGGQWKTYIQSKERALHCRSRSWVMPHPRSIFAIL